MKYGLPYKGSKNKLAKRIVGVFPKRKHLYDLFCGGCAVTHAAMSGGVILDNCMGSGTTAIACMREERNFIGFELNEEYYNKACERIERERSQQTLF